MTTDETIQAIEALPGGAPIYIDNYEILEVGKFCRVDDLKQLTAALKLYREFVGAIRQARIVVNDTSVNIDTHYLGALVYDWLGNTIATGTDPFDAWRNLRNQELSEIESDDV